MSKISISYKDLKREAEHQFLKGDFAKAYDIYNDMKERAFCQEQINECQKMMELCLKEPEDENRLIKLMKKIMSHGLFIILTMFFLTSFGKYDNTCFELVYESDNVKVYKNIIINDTLTNLHKDVIKHVAILDYQKNEPYNKPRPKTLKLYNIDF